MLVDYRIRTRKQITLTAHLYVNFFYMIEHQVLLKCKLSKAGRMYVVLCCALYTQCLEYRCLINIGSEIAWRLIFKIRVFLSKLRFVYLKKNRLIFALFLYDGNSYIPVMEELQKCKYY